MASFWDPALAGKAMIELALKVLNKEPVANGLNLNVPGYENLTLDGKVLSGQAWIDITKENVDDPSINF